MSDFTKRNEEIKKECAEIMSLLSDTNTELLKKQVSGLVFQGLIPKEIAEAKIKSMHTEVKKYLDTLLDEYNQNITNS